MVQSVTELHNDYIRAHQQAHIEFDHLANDILQSTCPDLSCTQCYYPQRTSPRTPFGRFWTNYTHRYPALVYSRRTQDAFAVLTSSTNTIDIRIAVRDIIFSCRYSSDIPNPRDIATALVQTYTHRFQLPTLPFDYQNIFDLYLDEPQSFSFEEPGNFSQYFGNLGSPVIQATSEDQSVQFSILPEDLETIYQSDESLPPYSEEVTHNSPPSKVPTWYIPYEQQDVLDYISDEETTPILQPITLPPPVPILALPEPLNNMGDQALRDAATAINNLATALARDGEKNLLTVPPFTGNRTQDPLTWLQEFKRAATANKWNAARKLELDLYICMELP